MGVVHYKLYLEKTVTYQTLYMTLPTLEKVKTLANLTLHIATLHSVRKAFMKAQTLTKLKWKGQKRNSTNTRKI